MSVVVGIKDCRKWYTLVACSKLQERFCFMAVNQSVVTACQHMQRQVVGIAACVEFWYYYVGMLAVGGNKRKNAAFHCWQELADVESASATECRISTIVSGGNERRAVSCRYLAEVVADVGLAVAVLHFYYVGNTVAVYVGSAEDVPFVVKNCVVCINVEKACTYGAWHIPAQLQHAELLVKVLACRYIAELASTGDMVGLV